MRSWKASVRAVLNSHLDSAASTSCCGPARAQTKPPNLCEANYKGAPATEALWPPGCPQAAQLLPPPNPHGSQRVSLLVSGCEELHPLGRSLTGYYWAPILFIASRALTCEILVAAHGCWSPCCWRALIGLQFIPAWSVPWGAPALILLLLSCTVSTLTSDLIPGLFI